jgi:hypothetical protein
MLLLLLFFGLVGTAPVAAQTTGSCELGSATQDLDVSNVRARLYNNGGLFWKGAGNVYNVPKAPDGAPISPNAIFAAGIWIGGNVSGQIRTAAATYSDWEFWPGPLDANGELPGAGDCAEYDRIFIITRQQLKDLDDTGVTTPDIVDWPWELGAPVVAVPGNGLDDDGDGLTDEGTDGQDNDGDGRLDDASEQELRTDGYDLAAGDRPFILGDQMAWWVMNDVGNTHATTGTSALGLEVQVSAFAFNLAGDLGRTTFYRYRLIYKGKQQMTDTYFGIWSDTDLGNASDDFVASDTTLGIGYVYNADNFDDGADGYGTPPPANGYDFFQGPLVPAPGETWVDPDGQTYPDQTRLKMTRYIYYNNDGTVIGNPRNNTSDYYNYLRGVWQDGAPVCFGGVGHPTISPPGVCNGTAPFMFPGDPVTAEFWSERNTDGAGTPNVPSDRRFVMATGPFTLNPGDVQDLAFGVITGFGADQYDSIVAMRAADALAQSAYDANFELPAAPDPPRVDLDGDGVNELVSELDGRVILTWGYKPTDNNYLESYEAFNPFSFDNGGDRTFNFEGYRVFQYPNSDFDEKEASELATFDVENGVLRVLQTGSDGLPVVAANGGDNGVRHYLEVGNLTNYKQYYFGLQAYGYNGNTDLDKVIASPVTRLIVTPSRPGARNGGTSVNEEGQGSNAPAQQVGVGEGLVTATVIDPAQVTGDSYTVEFFEQTVNDETFINYSIRNATKGITVVDGAAYGEQFGRPLDQKENIATIDGLSFSVTGPTAASSPTFPFKRFATISNAAGPLDPPEPAAFAFNSSGFPTIDGGPPGEVYLDCVNDRPNGARQQSTVALGACAQGWGVHTFGARTTFAEWIDRTVLSRGNLPFVGANDFEMRFTAGGGVANRAFEDGLNVTVPFELWNLGATANDPSDDVRMIPWVCEGACGTGRNPLVYDVGGDSPLSGGTNDPVTDAIYWFQPRNSTPGQAGYLEYEAAALAGTYDYEDEEVIARTVLMCWNCGSAAPYPQEHPEIGTTFRISTFKPNQPGDVWTIDTSSLKKTTGDGSAARAALEDMYIVPNPYKGASSYEVSNLVDVVRFTNMPTRATIRVFTLSGTLIKTIEKSGPETFVNWDLQTDEALPVASGMYLVHIEVPGLGEKVIKFGVVKKRIQLDVL